MISGIHNSIDTLHLLSNAKSRSISAENFTGEKGKGGMATEGYCKEHSRELGQKWKVSPCVSISAGETFTMADITGPGAINHIWMTFGSPENKDDWRDLILRMYWDGMDSPCVEVPAGDFFANGWNEYAHINSLAVCVNPARGFNCYWTMPFQKRARITMENRSDHTMILFYQIDYVEAEVDADSAYFCASFRREAPTEYMKDYTIIDGIKGKGQFVGTYMTWQVNNCGWWGEGEIKFYMDGDTEFPTICGTGTEDYFGGAFNFDVPGKGYTEFSTPYVGMPQVIRPDGLYRSQTRFGLYRWHITDPIRFETDLRVTIQDLGWMSGNRFMPQRSNISSVAFWYQTLPVAPFKPLGSKTEIETV